MKWGYTYAMMALTGAFIAIMLASESVFIDSWKYWAMCGLTAIVFILGMIIGRVNDG